MAPGQEPPPALPAHQWRWVRAPISIPALILPVLLLSRHPQSFGEQRSDSTVTQPAWDRSVSPSLTAIRSSKFHHRRAQALMASQAASNFNLPFLSPKSHSPSREPVPRTRPPANVAALAGTGEPGPSPPALMPPAQRKQQLPSPQSWCEHQHHVPRKGRGSSLPPSCPAPQGTVCADVPRLHARAQKMLELPCCHL